MLKKLLDICSLFSALCPPGRSVAEGGEKLGVYNGGKVCYNLYRLQKNLRFFWLFRGAASPCGDIKGRP